MKKHIGQAAYSFVDAAAVDLLLPTNLQEDLLPDVLELFVCEMHLTIKVFHTLHQFLLLFIILPLAFLAFI